MVGLAQAGKMRHGLGIPALCLQGSPQLFSWQPCALGETPVRAKDSGKDLRLQKGEEPSPKAWAPDEFCTGLCLLLSDHPFTPNLLPLTLTPDLLPLTPTHPGCLHPTHTHHSSLLGDSMQWQDLEPQVSDCDLLLLNEIYGYV